MAHNSEKPTKPVGARPLTLKEQSGGTSPAEAVSKEQAAWTEEIHTWERFLGEMGAPVIDQSERFAIGADLFTRPELKVLNDFFRLIQRIRAGTAVRGELSASNIMEIESDTRPLLRRLKERRHDFEYFIQAVIEDFEAFTDPDAFPDTDTH